MPRSDFNGDGRDDIFWQNSTASLVSNWLGTQSGGFLVNDGVALEYYLGDFGDLAAIGDFNGDGRSDTLWRYGDQIYVSYTFPDGAYYFAWSAGYVASVEVSWQILAAGDFDGNGRDDILWGSEDGRISNWLATDTEYVFTINDANAMTDLVTGSDVRDIGDFNEDGNDDLVFHFSNGVLSLAYGSDSGGWVFDDPFGQVPVDWRIEGVGDFNGDGNDDILWRNADGTLSNWLWAGGLGFGTFSVNDSNALVHVPVDWQIVGVGDYNGDGRDDILWRNLVSGAVSDWLATSNGGWTINDANALRAAPLEWSIQPASPGLGYWDY